jgi:sarcosine oxidase
MQTYDVIVIGAGGMGSAALYHLAKRGVKVLGLDRFPPGHDRGSSHGRTRVIRQAYFEQADYVPLLLRAYELWAELGQHCGLKLYYETGLLEVGLPAGQVVPGVKRAARQHRLEIEELSPTEARKRFPAFRIPNDYEAVFERRAGYLEVENCVRAHAEAAQQLGAELQCDGAVRDWNAVRNEVVVHTDRAEFRAQKLVIAAGAWSGLLLESLEIPLVVRRKPVFWYPGDDDSLKAENGCPVYLFELPDGVFYGIPQIDDWGFKVAEHTGGELVANPLNFDRTLRVADQTRVEAFLSQFIPSVGRPLIRHSVCLYTMSPDENFIVDTHPRYPQVCFAAGLSGHGFKFTCVLGEALADLALNGRTDLPIGFLNCRRFGTC